MTPLTSPLAPGRPSFLDAPRGADLDRLDADVVVLGVPYTTPHDLASSRAPSSPAPAAVREQSRRYVGRTDHHDFDLGGPLFAGRRLRLVDAGDVRAVPGRYDENARRATAAVGALLGRGALPVILGGDHAVAIPVARAVAAGGPVGVVHLGAELSWRDEADGAREAAPSAMRRTAELGSVVAMLQVGLRGSGGGRPEDLTAARRAGSVLVGAEEVHEAGVPAVLRRLPPAPRYLVSLDVGVLDPAIAPGVETPAFGGLTYFETLHLLKGVAARGPIAALMLVGIVPAQDLHDMTSLLGARLILTAIGALAHAGRLDADVGAREAERAPARRLAAVEATAGGRA